jgi:hypothetical protein
VVTSTPAPAHLQVRLLQPRNAVEAGLGVQVLPHGVLVLGQALLGLLHDIDARLAVLAPQLVQRVCGLAQTTTTAAMPGALTIGTRHTHVQHVYGLA